jgi:Cu-Zn family superoxide dismutase
MRSSALVFPLLLALGCSSPRTYSALTAMASIRDKSNFEFATAVFTESVDGRVEVLIDLTRSSTGAHGIHIHEGLSCDPPTFETAGSHFNPGMTMHGGPDTPMHHAGDFGNLLAEGASLMGVGTISFISGDISLRSQSATYIIGRTMIVHGHQDDLMSQPSGNSGPRIGCGVITPETTAP